MTVLFPDDIIRTVFSHLDPSDIARCERVNRQWNSVGRSSQKIWREFWLIDDRKEEMWSSAMVVARRLHAQLSRSGGRLDRLGIQLFVPDFDNDGRSEIATAEAEYFRDIFRIIPTLRLTELHVCLAPVVGGLCDPFDPFEVMYDVEEAIRQCRHLKILRFQSHSFLSTQASFGDTPLASCVLDELHFNTETYGVDQVFFDESLLKMLSHARHITLSVSAEFVYYLLGTSSSSLESLDLNVCNAFGDFDFPEYPDNGCLLLPKLQWMKIDIGSEPGLSEAKTEAYIEALRGVHLFCPALERLEVKATTQTVHLLQDLIKFSVHYRPILHTLHITDSSSNVDGLAAWLQDLFGASLRTLNFCGDPSSLIYDLALYPTMALDNVTFQVGREELRNTSALQVRELARSRLEDPSHRPFREIRFVSTWPAQVVDILDDADGREAVIDHQDADERLLCDHLKLLNTVWKK